MSGQPPDEPVVDEGRSCDLNNRLQAAHVLYPDREDILWVLDRGAEDSDPIGCNCRDCAPHDHIGHEDHACAETLNTKTEGPDD